MSQPHGVVLPVAAVGVTDGAGTDADDIGGASGAVETAGVVAGGGPALGGSVGATLAVDGPGLALRDGFRVGSVGRGLVGSGLGDAGTVVGETVGAVAVGAGGASDASAEGRSIGDRDALLVGKPDGPPLPPPLPHAVATKVIAAKAANTAPGRRIPDR